MALNLFQIAILIMWLSHTRTLYQVKSTISFLRSLYARTISQRSISYTKTNLSNICTLALIKYWLILSTISAFHILLSIYTSIFTCLSFRGAFYTPLPFSTQRKTWKTINTIFFWLQRVDSNHRPLDYEPNEIPLLHSAFWRQV